jgi:hypothetical protein
LLRRRQVIIDPDQCPVLWRRSAAAPSMSGNRVYQAYTSNSGATK